MTFVQPFDFQTILLNFFAGSIELVFLLGIFIIVLAGMKMKMNLGMGTFFVLIFTIILNGYAIYQGVLSPLLIVMAVVTVVIAIPIIYKEVLKS